MSVHSGRKDDCACGHDRSHHFDKTHNCLAMRCECKLFGEPLVPKTKCLPSVNYPTINRPTRRPHDNPHCLCDACYRWMIRGGYS